MKNECQINTEQNPGSWDRDLCLRHRGGGKGKIVIEEDLTVNARLNLVGGELIVPAGVTLTLEGVDPDDLTEARDYSFTVPDGLGAWVRTATFHEVDKPETSGKLTDDVSWEVVSTEAAFTLVLSGDGAAETGENCTGIRHTALRL